MMKTPNTKARSFVQSKQPFEGSNLFAKQVDDRYVVYSYGFHWPLFIYTHDKWFENEDKFSKTTAKHKTQTHPLKPTIPLPVDWMLQLVEGGYPAIAKERVLGGVLHAA
jgi:hypothetical protein